MSLKMQHAATLACDECDATTFTIVDGIGQAVARRYALSYFSGQGWDVADTIRCPQCRSKCEAVDPASPQVDNAVAYHSRYQKLKQINISLTALRQRINWLSSVYGTHRLPRSMFAHIYATQELMNGKPAISDEFVDSLRREFGDTPTETS